jgi:alcohol dehydrogenase (cytochrome c)
MFLLPAYRLRGVGRSKAVLDAIDYQTGKIKWSYKLGPNGSGAGNVIAMSTADGKTLWHAGQGAGMQSLPIAYEIDGREYIVTSAGGLMFAWALPLADS